jgi:hypothetical protein
VRQVEVEAAQQEDEGAGIRRAWRSFVADGFEKHGVKCIQEAGRVHARTTAVAGEAEAVMCDVVGSTVGGAVAIVVIVKPGLRRPISGGGKFSLGMRDEPGMWASIWRAASTVVSRARCAASSQKLQMGSTR